MDCREVVKAIEEQLNLKESSFLEHISSCRNCSQYYASAQKLRALFSKYDKTLDDKNGDDFDNALFIKLQSSAAQADRKRFRPSIIQIASALLFTVMISISVFYFSGQGPAGSEFVSSTETELNAPVRIVLEYEADADIEGVEVSFILDKGVRFYSENEKFRNLDSFIWKGDLKKGTNQIPFVVSAVLAGSWNITTEARFEGMKHRHLITFSTDDAKVAVALYKLESLSDKI
ncbi:MAG TPA: hypothetical protein VLJ60_03425 [bacterium]|nr:hypothetical protein [bacterium]